MAVEALTVPLVKWENKVIVVDLAKMATREWKENLASKESKAFKVSKEKRGRMDHGVRRVDLERMVSVVFQARLVLQALLARTANPVKTVTRARLAKGATVVKQVTTDRMAARPNGHMAKMETKACKGLKEIEVQPVVTATTNGRTACRACKGTKAQLEKQVTMVFEAIKARQDPRAIAVAAAVAARTAAAIATRTTTTTESIEQTFFLTILLYAQFYLPLLCIYKNI